MLLTVRCPNLVLILSCSTQVDVFLMFLKNSGFLTVVFDWFENVAPFSIHVVSGFSPVVVAILVVASVLMLPACL